MPGLSDKLRSLGVKVGTGDLPRPAPAAPTKRASLLEEILLGHALPTSMGETFLVENHYPAGHPHGRMSIQITAPLATIARWAGDERIASLDPPSFAFIDTETTGLSGGTGTYAFLVGVGRFEGDDFHLAQFFMRDPYEEPAQLAALEAFIAPCQALVTFNGKAFDIPLLHTRYTTHGWISPFKDSAHIDLLHLARRLWRDRLPSRTLGNLEVQILGAARSEEDVPGWMIPSLYFQYLRDGDPSPLKRVFYHNALDVISMVALFNHTADLLADPFTNGLEHSVDVIALARLYEELGDLEQAETLYLYGLEHDLPRDILLDSLQRLGSLYKRQGNYMAATQLWEQSSYYGDIQSFCELAKYYEHHARDTLEASRWTKAAIELVNGSVFPAYQRFQWLPDLQHRLERLERKLSRDSNGEA